MSASPTRSYSIVDINRHTKFEMPGFAHTPKICGLTIDNASRDPDQLLLGLICQLWAAVGLLHIYSFISPSYMVA